METEELTKLVDGIYKNILDKFNPGARQMINAGKAYLKALHGAAAASRLYVEAITKLARQAQQGTWGGSSDIGTALMQVVEVYKEIQSQQMNILKAFYVDLLVPLETNLEKDTKVVQSEQKKFLQQHKARSETYSKAAANMKKQRKKGSKSGSKTGLAMDKELKNMQILEEEKSKLDIFCEQSLKNAMTQERRRYGFVLERQCSLAKHYLAYHSAGVTSYNRHLDEWQDIARTREYLPESVENMFTTKLRQVSFWQDDDTFGRGDMDEDRISVASQLRKTKSMDASCLDVRSINDVTSPLKPLSRAKSEYNLNSSTHSLVQEDPSSPQRPKSMAIPDKPSWESPLARALYAYLSSGDNQLSFLEGDVIALLGERNKGWQFGENLRTQCSGWFPLAYTEIITDDSSVCSPTHRRMDSISTNATTPGTPGLNSTSNSNSGKPSPTTMFGDTLLHRRVVKQIPHRALPITSANLGPPPSQPAPIPELNQHNNPRSITTTAIIHPPQPLLSPRGDAATLPGKRGAVHPPPMPPLPLHLGGKRANGAPGSLHSSNDSGFSNDPPPQPEVDYSDDDSARIQRRRRMGNGVPEKKELMSSVRGWLLYKSAMDLWDDVNEQNGSKHPTVSRTLSARQNGGGTLGRFDSQDLMKSTPVAVEKIPEIPPPKITVKRTKSLWKFKKSNKNEILEGMSLWKHRSLIDVCKASAKVEEKKEEEEEEEEDLTENIYASAENIQNEKQKYIEKLNNEKNSQYPNEDGSDSVIVVNDQNKYKFDIYNGKSESQSDLSDSDTIQKEEDNYLPRTKLMKSNSNDLTTQYVVRDAKQKEYQTWNPNYRVKETKKWQTHDDNNLFKEKSNNKLKDTPKLFKDIQLTDNKTKCGPWYDLWGIDSSVKS